MKTALTIAGSDCSGGAGIQADLKAFAANGVFGMSVITAVTVQNTRRVFAVQDIDPEIITGQIAAVFEDIEVDAVKIGMVSRPETIEAVAAGLKKYRPVRVVLDPVMISTSGYHLLQQAAEKKLIAELMPLATVITPNIPEAEVISGLKIGSLKDMETAAAIMHQLGAKYVFLKGGHRPDDAIDVFFDGRSFHHFTAPHIATANTHGTGCTLSSAMAANLARGYDMRDAAAAAKQYVTVAIEHALPLGEGTGPIHHFYSLYNRAGVFNDS